VCVYRVCMCVRVCGVCVCVVCACVCVCLKNDLQLLFSIMGPQDSDFDL